MNKPEIVAEICDYLEGSLDPEQARRVEELIAEDPAYAKVHQELTGMGESLQLAPPPLPTGFATEVARSLTAEVMKKAAQPWWEKFWNRFRVAWSGQHPVVNLVESRATAGRRRLPSFTFIALLCGLPLFFLYFGHESSLMIYVFTQGLALLVGLPFFFFKSDVGALRSLRRGRCLEDLLCAGIDADGLVDTLAVHSLRSITRITLPVLLVMTPSFLMMPAKHRQMLLIPALLWPLAVALAFWVGSYVSQFQIAWSRRGESLSLPQIGLSLGLLAVVGPMLWCDCGFTRLAGLVVLVGASRFLAIWGLTHAEQVDRWNEHGPRGDRSYRNPWVQAGLDNPIVVRESYSEAGALAGGRWGFLPSRGLVPLLAVVWSGIAASLYAPPIANGCSRTDSNVELFFWTGVVVAILYALIAPMTKAAAAVVRERERDTWETLLQTGLDGRTFVEGWTHVTSHRVAQNMRVAVFILLFLPVFIPWEVLGENEPILALLTGWIAAAVLWLAPRTGARVGLWISERHTSRREAGLEVVKALMTATVAVMACWAVLAMGAGMLGSMRWLESGALWFKPFVQRTLPLLAVAIVLGLANYLLRELKFGLTQVAPQEAPGLPEVTAPAQGAPLIPVWMAAASLCLLWSLPLSWVFTPKAFSLLTVVGFLLLLCTAGRWLVNGAKRYLWTGSFRGKAVLVSLSSGALAAVTLYVIPHLVLTYGEMFVEHMRYDHGEYLRTAFDHYAGSGLMVGIAAGLLGCLLSVVLKQPDQPATTGSGLREVLLGWATAVFAPLLLLLSLSLLCLSMAGYNPERDAVADNPYDYPYPYYNLSLYEKLPFDPDNPGEMIDKGPLFEVLERWTATAELNQLEPKSLRKLLKRLDEAPAFFHEYRKCIFAYEIRRLEHLPYPVRRLEQSTLWDYLCLPSDQISSDTVDRFRDRMVTWDGRRLMSPWYGWPAAGLAEEELKCLRLRARVEARLQELNS